MTFPSLKFRTFWLPLLANLAIVSIVLLGTGALGSFLDPATALAAGETKPPATTTTGNAAVGVFLPFGSANLPTLIGRIIRYFVGFVGAAALVMFIYAGALWMTARGQEEQVSKAKAILLWSTLGIAAVLGAYGLVRLLFWITYNKE